MYRKLLLSTVIATTMSASAQNMCESIATRCEQHITENYIPDGQFYRALLQGDEIAEFSMTLFGGTTYRIAACSGETDGILLFTVYDREHNIPVSYTHLRAHETVLDLVCRLLLEKKKI